jgi:hypothetical protein
LSGLAEQRDFAHARVAQTECKSRISLQEVVCDAEGWAGLGRPRDHQNPRFETPRAGDLRG